MGDWDYIAGNEPPLQTEEEVLAELYQKGLREGRRLEALSMVQWCDKHSDLWADRERQCHQRGEVALGDAYRSEAVGFRLVAAHCRARAAELSEPGGREYPEKGQT